MKPEKILMGLQILSNTDPDEYYSCAKNPYSNPSETLRRFVNAACPSYLTENEAVDYLRITKSRIYDLRKAGKIKSVSFGRSHIYPVEVLDQYMEENTQ